MTTEPTPTRRRWFQYRLRTLLIVMLVVSLGMGWVMKERRRIAEQRESLKAAGFRYLINEVSFLHDVHEMFFGFDFRFASGIDGTIETTDSGLVHLAGLTQLQSLSLQGRQVTDAGLAHLRTLTQLQTLSLHDMQVSDAGLIHLQGLKQLQYLSLGGTQVTDAGLAHLRRLTQLQDLSLGGTQISDSGLVHLQGLTQLRYLYLADTRVTDVGVAKLQAALPNCTIDR